MHRNKPSITILTYSCRYGVTTEHILWSSGSLFTNVVWTHKPHLAKTWWRHQMETFSALLAICAGNSPVPGEFPAQRPVTRSFDVFFDLRMNKRLSKQSWGWWSETISHPLWRHRNDTGYCYIKNKSGNNFSSEIIAKHSSDVIMSAMASQITAVSFVCSTVCWGANEKKHQSSASLAFVRGESIGHPLGRTSDEENVSIWWRHHEKKFNYELKLLVNSLRPNDAYMRR